VEEQQTREASVRTDDYQDPN